MDTPPDLDPHYTQLWCRINPQSPTNTPEQPQQTLETLIGDEHQPQVANIISGMRYRVITIEEQGRNKIEVSLNYFYPPSVPNVIIKVPREPTTVLHMPQNTKFVY